MSAFTSRRGTPGRNPRRTSLVRISLARPNKPCKDTPGGGRASYEAVDKYIVAVHLAWAYVEQRFAQERSAQVRTYGDIIRQHRDEHAIDWLKGAIEMAVETGDPELVLQRFLRLET